MRNTMIALLMTLWLPLAAFAQTPISMFYSSTGWAVASDNVFASNGLPLAFNAAYDTGTSSAANYILSTYGSTNQFGSLVHATQGNAQTWTESTSPIDWLTTTIQYNPGGYSVNVAEDASALACTRNGAAAEYDIFMAPDTYDMGTNVVSAINTAYRAHPENAPFLTQLASLTVSGTAVVNSFSQPIPVPTCATDHAGLLFAYLLIDRQTNQMFKYSLSLAHPCPPGTQYNACVTAAQPIPPYWYTASGLNAVTDFPTAYGSGITIVPKGGSPIAPPLITAGTVTLTALNLLPRFEALIQSNPLQLDQNIAHWQIGGPSYGTNIWGDFAVNTSWYGFNPAASCIRPNCS